MAASSCNSSTPSRNTTITVVELGHNSSNVDAADRKISMDKYQQLLQDAGKVDCPLLAALGYPTILVSTTPGQKCIPKAMVLAVGNNPRNNRMATVAASHISTGLTLGCVVYALRTDGTDLNSKEWYILWDMLMRLMDDYGDGPGSVNEALLNQYKGDVRRQMRQKGLLKSGGAGTGVHCWGCGVEGDEDVQLFTCASCKSARYCSKTCQRAHWKAGHREECRPPQTPQQAEAAKAQQLLESAVLKPEQIISRNAAVPPLPGPCDRKLPPNIEGLSALMPGDDLAIFMFNKDPNNGGQRLCLSCKTLYRLVDPAPDDQCSREQALSGICSYSCWCAINKPGTRYATPEWYGQEAMNPSDHGVMLGY